MDLITCKVDAADLSKKNGKAVYIVVDEEGECSLENAPLKGVIAKYKGGQEVPLNGEDEIVDGAEQVKALKAKAKEDKKLKQKEVKAAASEKATANSKTKKMATETKKKPAKKVAAKKAPAKKVNNDDKFPVQKGAKKTLTIKEIRAGIKKGFAYYNEANRPLPEGYLSKMTDQAREIKVTEVKVAE